MKLNGIRKACEVQSETRGIAERAVRREKEGTSAVQQYSQDWLKGGG